MTKAADIMAAATPGPWKQSGTNAAPHWYVFAPECAVHGPQLRRYPDTPQQTVDRWMADARAIVTAVNLFPLYEAVREAARAVMAEHRKGYWSMGTMDGLDVALDALQAAEDAL